MAHIPVPPSLSRQNFGSLSVQLSSPLTSGPLQPIEGVNVTIKGISPTGESTTLAELTSNSVGQTEDVVLEAPPVDLSLDQSNTQLPYATYRVETSSPNFVDAVVDGTQVFANTRSIQPIALEPTLNSSSSRSRRRPSSMSRQLFTDIVIGPSTLYGDYPEKIPEAPIKPITPGSGFIVLDRVIVPEFIIVHAGTPNDDSAPNYTVPFTDYISNVASSEIYPTWPTETIRANIIAIVSFTLNRVYTEWYRNQGKSFTITNSTAYDHAFFYGRNLFDSIVEITAEVFDVYIKRPDVTQPLLSQYCDGQKSSCPNWMTQWGSKSLGDQGYSAEEILRYFYGNITLDTAPQVEGNPESYPGSPLTIGSSGSAVRTIQTQLNRISNNYPLIEKVAVNGQYDEDTANSVKTFQQIFNLTPDGIVGKSTWYEISRIYVAVTKLAELG
ncbi:MAG: peptidoglycan-binding protein [Cellulosilyticum sp.]|nr:peptidoglycan-binding protein [Cellulosilyticum sp.]MEE1073517.1 peptidoglycan-binding protein [Cellulosilyticum sp.]